MRADAATGKFGDERRKRGPGSSPQFTSGNAASGGPGGGSPPLKAAPEFISGAA
jgi:hypothetical protein